MSRRRHLEQGSLFALSLLPLMMAASGAAAQALPTGGSVAAGAATIGYTTANDMTISQTSVKAIINWGDFSIGAGKSVTFNNGAGATLNRVTGANVSNIQGALAGTGSVYLINPNGVIIGATGRVNVGDNFVASALNVTDANFLAGGALTFEGPGTGVVKNLGQIGALGGDVALIATTVSNEGAITTYGATALVAGKKVLMRDVRANDGKFVVEVGAGDVTNVGAITAVEAELRTNGGNVYALAGNTSGVINAGSVNDGFSVFGDNSNGRVFLTAGTGNVTSNGVITTSNNVTMQGAQVAIVGTQLQSGSWSIDADSFAIGDAEATTLNAAMVANPTYSSGGVYQGSNVAITAHAGDVVLDTTSTSLNFGDRSLQLTASGNVTLHDAVRGLAVHNDNGSSYTDTGNLSLRSDSEGVGAGVVTLVDVTAGYLDVTTNVANYATGAAAYGGYSNGNGTDVIMLVNTYADLKRIAADYDGSDANGRFLVGHDIDASASTAGDYVGAELSGIFDGQGHTISNLTLTGERAGLFHSINNGTVTDLNLTGSVRGTGAIGAVTGEMADGYLLNIHSSMTVTSTDAVEDASNSMAGGLVGHNQGSTIESSTVDGAVTGFSNVGGLVGKSVDGTFYYNEVTGTVTGVDNVGGMVGNATGGNYYGGVVSGDVFGVNAVGGFFGLATSTYNNSAATTGATHGASAVGGLIGSGGGVTVYNADVSGAVSGADHVGGLIGVSASADVQNNSARGDVTATGAYAGGLIGGDASGGTYIQGNIASGAVTGFSNVGGLVGGLDYGGTIESNQATGDVTGALPDGESNSGFYFGGLVGYMGSGVIRYSSATGAVAGGQTVGGLLGSGVDVQLQEVYATGAVSGTDAIGGLVGLFYGGSLSGGHATGAVIGRDRVDLDGLTSADIGGLIGFSGNGASVDNAWASGDVSGVGRTFGGLIGLANGGTYSSLQASGNVTGQNQVGGLIGFTGGGTSVSDSSASGAVTGDYSDNFDPAEGGTGGLIGYADQTQLTNAYATGAVNGRDNTGGLIGRLAHDNVLTTTWANGAVTGDTSVGGLIGLVNSDGNANTISQSYATGAVNGGPGLGGVGGLIGLIQNTYGGALDVHDSYASGAVSGDDAVGGLIGEIASGDVELGYIYATGSTASASGWGGGLIGVLDIAVNIHDGYASGLVNRGVSGGGLFARHAGGSFSNLYWDADTTGRSNVSAFDLSLAGASVLWSANAYSAAPYTFTDPSKWTFIDGLRPLLTSEWSTTINNVHQLQLIALDTSASYTLGSDFSAAETNAVGAGVFGANGFATIGMFSGYLDGHGHQISDLNIRGSSWNAGLFGTIETGGTVLDVALIGGSVTTDVPGSNVGAIAGTNNGRLVDIYSSMSVTGSQSAASVNPMAPALQTNSYAGGLIGYNNGSIDRVSVHSQVVGYRVGGVAGDNDGGRVADATVGGVLTGYDKVGGIVGEGQNGYIDTVLATSQLIYAGNGGSGGNVGAIIGLSTDGVVQNARWSTTIMGSSLQAIGAGSAGTEQNNLGYSTADLQDETKTSDVYSGFGEYWAPGSSAAASSDGQAHFAELYRADNVVLIDARGEREYGYAYEGFETNVTADLRDGDTISNAVVTTIDNAAYNVGTYHLNVTGGQAVRQGGGAYRTITLNTFKVTPRTLYVDVNGGVVKTYDGTNTVSLDGSHFNLNNQLDGADLQISGTAHLASYVDNGEGYDRVDQTNVNEGRDAYSALTELTLSGADAGNYRLDQTTISSGGYINRAVVTATANGGTKTYDGTTALGGNATTGLTGLIGDDTLSVGFGGLTYADKNVGASKAIVGGVTADLSDTNYALTSFDVSGSGQIGAKTITADLTGAVTKTYDGSIAATLGDNLALAGLIEGDTVGVGSTGAIYADKNAGTGKTVTAGGLTLSGADHGNYVLASTTATGSIGRIDAKTIAAGLTGAVTKTYDGSIAATLGDNLALAGLIEGDTVGVGSTGATYADKNAGTGKTVTAGGLSLSGADHDNYVLASTTATGSIGRIDAKTIAAGLTGAVTKTYDGSTAASLGDNLALTGLVAGDTVTVAATGAAFGDKNAATGKTVIVNGVSLGGTDAGNYVLASTTASGAIGVISTKGLTVNGDDKIKNRGDIDPALTYVANGLVAGDSLTGGLTRDVGETVGAYGITQGTLSAGGNYAITFRPAVLTINLGVPPVENLIIPYIPAESSGSAATNGSPNSNTAGQNNAGTSVGFQLATQDQADQSQQQQQGGDDTTTCAAGETCTAAPYTQGGSTSGAIHFQGFTQ